MMVVSLVVISVLTACVFLNNSKLYRGVVGIVVLLEFMEKLSWAVSS
jgi:hypothetical protein